MGDSIELQTENPKVAEAIEKSHRLIASVESVIFGKREAIELVLTALLSNGHILLEDVPGVGKTMLAKTFALSLNASFKRIQFTPDLLPSDITGTSVYNQKTSEFYFSKGPLFANFILADEINRTSPRTQSALLEAMEERQITVDGTTYPLPETFFVMATMNPIEHSGTYDLPEAQKDRFLLRIKIGYPDQREEVDILNSQMLRHPIEEVRPILDLAEVKTIQEIVKRIHITDAVKRYIVRVVSETRTYRDVLVGCSYRGSLGLLRTSQALALLRGRDFVIPDDAKLLAPVVLAHRILLIPEAELSGVTPQQVVREVLKQIPVPKE